MKLYGECGKIEKILLKTTADVEEKEDKDTVELRYIHDSPKGTIWISTIVNLYKYYHDRNEEKAELLLDLLKFAPEVNVEEKEDKIILSGGD